VNYQSGSLAGKDILYLDTDHSGLNKFSGFDDENFKLVSLGLKALSKDASIIVEQRNKCTRSIFESESLLPNDGIANCSFLSQSKFLEAYSVFYCTISA
jgi:hypothetical protein